MKNVTFRRTIANYLTAIDILIVHNLLHSRSCLLASNRAVRSYHPLTSTPLLLVDLHLLSVLSYVRYVILLDLGTFASRNSEYQIVERRATQNVNVITCATDT